MTKIVAVIRTVYFMAMQQVQRKCNSCRQRFALTFAWIVIGTALVASPAARADVLTITLPSGGNAQLRLQGIANKDYAIQTTPDLAGGNWVSLGAGATDGEGLFQTTDTATKTTACSYRAAQLPGLQTATDSAATMPGSVVMITLDGNDPLVAGGALSAVITWLPASGTLEQIDGTPITAVGTVVSDSRNRVRFVPAAGNSSSPDFGYELKRASNGVTSAPQTVAVSLSPKWVYSSFDDATQQLQLAYSQDGVRWANTGDIYSAPSGNGVRDSSIAFLNGAYYIAYTAGNFGMADFIQICRSTDLVHWTYLCNVDTTLEGTGIFSWAPEWFVDQDGTVYLYLCREVVGGSWRLFWTRPTNADLTQWATIQTVGGDMASRGAIDPQVVRDGNTYYLVYRNYGPSGGTDCIEMATGTSPTSFTLFKTGNWAGWGTPREGPFLVHVGGAHWRIYYILTDSTLGGSPVARSESIDNMLTWTPAVATGLPNHGTCFLLEGVLGASPSATPRVKRTATRTGGSRAFGPEP